MKSHILAQGKAVNATIFRNFPMLGNGGYDLQIGVELHQTIKKHVYGPAAGLVASKGWVERTDATFLVIAKNLLVLKALRALTSLYCEDGG